MRTWLASSVLGACALATVLAAERLIAPFHGLGPFLTTATLSVVCLSLAAGFAWGSRGAAGASAAWLLVAAGWTLVVPWIDRPLLLGLEAMGLRAATLAGVALFVGVPLMVLAATLARLARSADDAAGRGHGALAAALVGAALAAPLVIWAAIPSLGVSRTLVVAGALEAIVAWLAFGTAGARRLAAPAIALTAIGVLTAARLPATVADPAHGLVESRDGAAAEYRVITRDEGRYLLCDGTVQTVISNETGDPLHRAAAALRIFDLLHGRPDSVLVLGLRGGALAKRLAREGWRVRAVEPDPTAIGMATRHLSLDLGEIPVTAEDVRVFARRDRGRYPVIILDAFGGSAVPHHLVTRECFGALEARLTPGGVLALAIETQGWEDPLLLALAATLRTRFPHVAALPTSEPPNALGSIVLLASARPLVVDEEKLPDPAEYHMNPELHWGVVQMNHAWLNRYEPKPAGAIVLTDDRNPVDLWSARIQHASRVELHEFFGPRGRAW